MLSSRSLAPTANRAPFFSPQPKRSSNARTVNRQMVSVKAGLFDFITPGKTTTNKPQKNKAIELVDALLEISERTDAGLKASPAVREQIEELVQELEAYCPRNPLSDERILGEWEILYASKPQTAGGPFRSPIGRTIFPGQKALQIIEAPDICINEVSYKTLGFLPGAARQEGVIEPIDGNTFNLVFPALDGKKGGPRQRVIQIAYLDDRIRVARFIPENEEDEGSFYVFRRTDLEEEEEDEEEEEEEVAPPPPRAAAKQRQQQPKYVYADEEPEPEPVQKKRGAFGTQIFGKKDGMATQAERAYNKSRGAAPPPPPPPAAKTTRGSGTQRLSREEQIAARNAAEEERRQAKAAAEEDKRRAREQAAAAKARQEEEKREARAALEEERRRAREAAEEQKRAAVAAAAAAREELAAKKQAAKEQFDTLKEVATASAEKAKEAAAEFKEAQRETAALLKEASQSQSKVDSANGVVEQLVEQLRATQAEEKQVASAVLTIQRAVNDMEKQARQSLSQLISSGKKK